MAMKHDVSGRKHRCIHCSETFSAQTKLNHHIINHHQSAEISCFDTNCSLKFKNSTTHKVHYVRAHLQGQHFETIKVGSDYRCLTCRKIFNSKSSVVYHVATCSPASPFCKDGSASAVATLLTLVHAPEQTDDLEALASLSDIEEMKQEPSFLDSIPDFENLDESLFTNLQYV